MLYIAFTTDYVGISVKCSGYYKGREVALGSYFDKNLL